MNFLGDTKASSDWFDKFDGSAALCLAAIFAAVKLLIIFMGLEPA